MMNKAGVYEIRNIFNGHVYYGSTKTTFEERWYKHLNALRKSKHENGHLQNAWNKYGEAAFEFNVVLVCHSNSATYYEQLYLDMFFDDGLCCYNMNRNATGGGRKHTIETRQKISAAQIGRTLTAEQKQAMSDRFKGRQITWGDKISQSLKGKRLGTKHTEETRRKQSEAHKGKAPKNLAMLTAQKRAKANLTEERVMEVIMRLLDGETQTQISTDMCIAYGTVNGIKSGRRWASIIDKFNQETRAQVLLLRISNKRQKS